MLLLQSHEYHGDRQTRAGLMRNKAVKYPLSVLSGRDRGQKARVSTNGWFGPRCSAVEQKPLECNGRVSVALASSPVRVSLHFPGAKRRYSLRILRAQYSTPLITTERSRNLDVEVDSGIENEKESFQGLWSDSMGNNRFVERDISLHGIVKSRTNTFGYR